MSILKLNANLQSHSFYVTLTEDTGKSYRFRLLSVHKYEDYVIRVRDEESGVEDEFSSTARDSWNGHRWQRLWGKDPADGRSIYRGFYSLTGLNIEALK